MAKKQTKRALITSVISLLVCFSMLVGTTFAWFTDSVTSSGNIIKSGTLDVAMSYADAKADPASATFENAENKAIFKSDLWEPGYTEARHIKIENKGTLALKYQLRIVANGEVSDLADVIDVYYADPAQQVATRADVAGLTKLGTLTQVLANLNSAETTATGSLAATESVTITLVLSMQTTAGNEYQNKSIGTNFSIQLIATQDTVENDSFNNQYDKDSEYPEVAEGEATVNPTGATVITLYDTTDSKGLDADNNPIYDKVATVTIPADAVDPNAEKVSSDVAETATNTNITVSAGNTAKTFDINVTGLKPGNTVPVKVELFFGMGYDSATVKLYHHETEIDAIYNSSTGYIIFESATFSPFTVEYNPIKLVAPVVPDAPVDPDAPAWDPDVLPEDMQKAVVTELDNVVIDEWSSMGPINAADVSQQLDAVYLFKAPHDSDSVENYKYKDWHCDYYVMMDRYVPDGAIFLGGNYGDFGWVGFSNDGLPVEANVAVPLLGSVTENPWTYEAIVGLVGEFKCGVALSNALVNGTLTDEEDAPVSADVLDGATFTVMLRLTNPDNADEYYNVETITYTFPTNN